MAANAVEHPWQLRQALDGIVRDSLGLALGWMAALLAFFAVADRWIVPAHASRIAAVDGLTSVVMLAVFVAFRYRNAPARWANAAGAGVAIVTALGIFHDMWTLADPEQTTYLMLVVVGAGSILLSSRWMAAVVAVSFAGWAAVAFAHPQAAWMTFGFALFATCVLSLVVHTVRLHTYSRLESVARSEAERTQELVNREEALQRLVGALQESEDRYRRLVEQAPDAFLVFSDRKIIYVNPAGVRLFGAERAEDLIGSDPLTLVHPDDLDLVRERNEQIERRGIGTQFIEITIRTIDGRDVVVETLGQPILYMGKPADQTIVRDVTDRKRAEQERIEAARHLAEIDRLKEMDRVKTQFVNTISHELRTPLTPVRVQLHLLKRGLPAPEAYQKSIGVLERNFQRVNGLVDELLEVARIQAGTLRISKTRVDVRTVIGQAIESYGDVAKQQGVELTSTAEGDLDVLGDPARLTQVLYNLLGNAFKFTPRGGRVGIDAREEGGDAVVRIRDSGPGLSKEEMARLFEPFSQVHDTMEKTNAGTGLGLYICRGIVEGHDGAIWCESDGHGKGTTFAFRIPLHATVAPEGEAPAADVLRS